MKKYIGLTIFLIGTILASFWIAISSGKLAVKNTNQKQENIKNTNIKIKTTNQEKEKKQETNLESKKNEFKKQNDLSWESITNNWTVNNLSWESTDNSWTINNLTWDEIIGNIQTSNSWENFSATKEFIFIGLAQANLYSWDKYNDIFSLFELDNIPTYKIEWKEIYIKKLNSIEYKDEKNIIGRLIQKIWGNMVQTNIFGEKQTFINIDLFYKKEVLMLVEYDWKLYFVILPYKLYHQYKKFLKEVLFVKAK